MGERLGDVVRRQSALIDSIFGSGTYEIADEGPGACSIRSAWMELALCYDPRDQWVSAQSKPLTAAGPSSHGYPVHLWLKYLGIDVGVSRKSALDDRQVADELLRVRPLVDLFKDPATSRDACWFVRGYNHAYTEWCSGQWDTTE